MQLTVRRVTLPFTLICCRYRDQVLLVRRSRAPFRDYWNFLGGKIAAGESPTASARRELKEEAGIHSKAVRLRFRGVAVWPHEEHEAMLVGMYLFDAVLSRSPRRMAQTFLFEEGILAWWSAVELQENRAGPVVPNLRFLLKHFLHRSRVPRLVVMWQGRNDRIEFDTLLLPRHLRSVADWPEGPAELKPTVLFGGESSSDRHLVLDLPNSLLG